jgi:hypothetical protein
MSFDVFFETCRFAKAPVEAMNPLTGQAEMRVPMDPISSAELAAVQSTLNSNKAVQLMDDGCYDIETGDGGSAQIIADNLSRGCMFKIQGLTSEVVSLLFDVLKAGNWVMFPVMENLVGVTCSPGSVSRIPNEFPELVVCGSSDELGMLLCDGFDAWRRYRDSIVRPDPTQNPPIGPTEAR